MSYRNKKLLFYFDQYFKVRLGENTYSYSKQSDNLSILRAVLSLIVSWLSSIFQSKRRQTVMPGHHYKHLFYLETINQRNAIRSLLEKSEQGEILLLLNNNINQVNLEFPGLHHHFHWPARKVYLMAVINLFFALVISASLRNRYKGRIAKHHVLINLALFLSAVSFLERWLFEVKPETVTLVNDHNLFPLALLLATSRRGIPSIYVQHASVSDVFPKLLCRVALLEGQHAVDTYNRIGCYARSIELVGIPRMDGYVGYHGDKEVSLTLTVGLCLKTFYTKDQIEGLLKGIKRSGRVNRIILRPHPGSPKQFWDELRNDYGVELSNSKTENAVQFLSSIDVLVSGESTIVLEASLMKMPSIHFDDGSFFFPFDMYGLVRNNVAYCSVKNPTDISSVIDNLHKERVLENFNNCKYYCSTVQTQEENNSTGILLNFYRRYK